MSSLVNRKSSGRKKTQMSYVLRLNQLRSNMKQSCPCVKRCVPQLTTLFLFFDFKAIQTDTMDAVIVFQSRLRSAGSLQPDLICSVKFSVTALESTSGLG